MSRSSCTLRSSIPRASRHSRRPWSPMPRMASASRHRLQIADPLDPKLSQPRARRRRRRPISARRPTAPAAHRPGARQNREAARLIHVGSELRQELAELRPTETVTPTSRLHAARQTAPASPRRSRRAAPRSRRDRERLRRSTAARRCGVSAPIIARMRRPAATYSDMSRGNASTASGHSRSASRHRHGGAHATDAGDVAGGRHHAALAAAADDHAAVPQLGTVALLDRGVKSVAIDMGDAPARRRRQDRAAAASRSCGQRLDSAAKRVRQSRQEAASPRRHDSSVGSRLRRAAAMLSGASRSLRRIRSASRSSAQI